MNPVTDTGCTSVDIGVSANLELVDKFCYLGDLLRCRFAYGPVDATVSCSIQSRLVLLSWFYLSGTDSPG